MENSKAAPPPELLTEHQAALVRHAGVTVRQTAAEIAGGPFVADETAYRDAYCQTKDRLAEVLTVIAELAAAARDDTRKVGEIRGVLAVLNAPADRQHALRAIERIVGGER